MNAATWETESTRFDDSLTLVCYNGGKLLHYTARDKPVTKRTGYFSYLLRMWQTRDGEACAWRASLEQPGTQERRGFATLEELFDFLRQQVSPSPEQAEDEAAGGKASVQSASSGPRTYERRGS